MKWRDDMLFIIIGDAEADEISKPVKKKAELKMRMKMVELLVSMVMMWLEVEKK